MSSEYKRLAKIADDAAEALFEEVQKKDDMDLLAKKHEEILMLYVDALGVTKPSTIEQKEAWLNMSSYVHYKMIVYINSGEFAKSVGSGKTATTKELQVLFDGVTFAMDEAIKINDRYKELYIQERTRLIEEFTKELSEVGVTVRDGGCYIATAIYGSYDCPQVWTLRRYRDRTLSKHIFGKLFIRFYYLISPAMIKQFGNKKWFIHFFRKPLDAIVEKLHNKGYEDTPYSDYLL